jgi:hypothetical protein
MNNVDAEIILNNGYSADDKNIKAVLTGLEKWYHIAYIGGVDYGDRDCELCQMYRLSGCVDCPVVDVTGGANCSRGPYYRWYLATKKLRKKRVHDNETRIDAENLVAFCCDLYKYLLIIKAIEKWNKILDGSDVDQGIRNCPLCKVFWKDSREHAILGCTYCPIVIHLLRTTHTKSTADDLGGCCATPYLAWSQHHHQKHSKGEPYFKQGMTIDCDDCLSLAVEEADFLKKLKVAWKRHLASM